MASAVRLSSVKFVCRIQRVELFGNIFAASIADHDDDDDFVTCSSYMPFIRLCNTGGPVLNHNCCKLLNIQTYMFLSCSAVVERDVAIGSMLVCLSVTRW